MIGRQSNSGLSAKAFCERERLCTHTFYMWRRRFGKEAPVKFAEVRVRPEPQPNSGLELDLPGGERLRIPAGVDGATLRAVLAALRERV